MVGQQDIAACTPAFGDVLPLVGPDTGEDRIDDAQQGLLVAVHGKTEAVRFVLAEIGHADVLQVALVDHVMGGNGIAEKHIGLVKGHGIQRIQIGRIDLDDRIGVQRFDFFQGQVVVDKAQAQARQPVIERAGFCVTGDQYRLVDRIGC